jgi:L-alanine-DL-glutamate epimerase-like enolase superfamily enzyme
MKITEVKISVFELPDVTRRVEMFESGSGPNTRWVSRPHGAQSTGHRHVLHVRTDEGVEGVCTVGDVRYTAMTEELLEQVRIIAVGSDPLDRDILYGKLEAATRHVFAPPGWFGAFDNCLWDIAGKVAGLPVHALIGRVREAAPAYYNIRGDEKETAVQDAVKAVALGFRGVKDHFRDTGRVNMEWFRAVRSAVGPDVDLMHDAAGCAYSLDEALRVGRALEELEFRWFEEPLPDRHLRELQTLCAALDVPVLNPETLMNDVDLSAEWLISGATDLLRANARHGTTPLLKLARLAEMHGTTIELNGPGGLFGLVHAQLMCCIPNTSCYEYFPGGTRDEVGKEIGLLNPPVPVDGYISPPEGPGWGAEWDWPYFLKKRVAEL